MSPRSDLLLLLLSFSFALVGCPTKNNTVVDGGTSTDGGGTDGGGSDGGGTDGGGNDGGVAPVLGESCENPFELVAGTQASGDSSGAADDFSSDCADGSAPGQPDVVYHFTLSEPSGVEIVMNGLDGFDGILILYKDACTAGSEFGACVDEGIDAERIAIGLADPGEYYLVVDGWDTGGAFTVDLSVTPGGICVADALEADGNETAATASGTGFADLDTRDLDPATPGPDPFPLNICAGDVDTFLIGHLGGDLHLDAAATSGSITTQVFEALIDPTTGDVSEGTSLGPVPYTGADATRGYYLLKVDAASPPVTGSDYYFLATHGCQGDADDGVLPSEDDEVYARAVYAFYQSPSPIDRSLCLTDRDVFVLQNIAPGDITLDLTGAAAFDFTVEEMVDDGSGGKMPQAYTGTVTSTPNGNDLQIVLPAAPVGEYLLTLSLPAGVAPGDKRYTFALTFAGLSAPPSNDGCAAAETLLPGAAPTPLAGRTVGAADDLIGPCGNEDVAVAAGGPGAKDVFYALNLPADTALQIDFDGGLTSFLGQVYLLALPGPSCPADLTTLAVVNSPDGTPACRTGRSSRLRLPAVTAGDYLLVVDGFYQEAFFIFPEEWTEGGFSISATTFAGGLPLPAACSAVSTITLPASGGSKQAVFDNTGLGNSLDAYGDCAGGGGQGFEKVFTITPAADAAVTVTAEGYDTILALHEADCEFGATVACNDDNSPPGNFGSQITASLTAGTTYYLIVDAWAADELGTATVTIAVQ